MNDIQYAGRKTDFASQFGQHQRGERCDLRWFQHHLFPQARLGASLIAALVSGKFQGIIAAMTPIGSRNCSVTLSGRVP